MSKKLQQTFTKILQDFSADEITINDLWQEIITCYSDKKRHYHNLKHLENMFSEMREAEYHFADFNLAVLALFYHDMIYDAMKQDNEQKSAELTGKRLSALGIPQKEIIDCQNLILATKSHTASDDKDINLFTDADLSILGKGWDEYLEYSTNIRREYSIFPDTMYKSGRKKVLSHFLMMERIFKSKHFFDKFEVKARINISKELELLSR